ncbi:MAG: hypothetical protein PVG89_17170 [Gammaproteobacteria bacterium]|jgi:hypothetical protein
MVTCYRAKNEVNIALAGDNVRCVTLAFMKKGVVDNKDNAVIFTIGIIFISGC